MIRQTMRPLRSRCAARAFSSEWGSSVPHGGKLIDRMVPDAERQALLDSVDATLEITERQSCDVEMIVNGAYSPLEGFMAEGVYSHVVENMRLPESNVRRQLGAHAARSRPSRARWAEGPTAPSATHPATSPSLTLRRPPSPASPCSC